MEWVSKVIPGFRLRISEVGNFYLMKGDIKPRWGFLFTLTFLCLLISCDDKGSDPPPGGGPEPPILPAYFDHPAWHPAGEWIAAEHADSIDSDSDGRRDRRFSGIWLVHAQTGQRQPLIIGFGLPAWSPDGRTLAMVRGGQIFRIDVVSLEPVRVDTNSFAQLTTEGRNFYPAWSPDGLWIIYDTNFNDPVGANVIWKMTDDGTDKRDISEHSVGEWRMPNWSPNGRHIVHQRYLGAGAPEIVVMDTSGQNPSRLTFDDRGDFHPNTPPTAQGLLFTRNRVLVHLRCGS